MKSSPDLCRVAFLVCFLVAHSAAANEKLSSRAGVAREINLLPKHVQALDGKLTLFADYADVRGESIVLYLVNKTPADVPFLSEDGHLYIKLEKQHDDGRWERVQSHQYSWCGNSYYSIVVKPDHFIRFLGKYPSKGEPCKVRYRPYDGSTNSRLVSNVGHGRVAKKDVDRARYDQMSISRVPQSLQAVLEDNDPLPALGPTTPERRVAALRLLQTFDRAYHFRREAEKWSVSIADDDDDGHRAAQAIQALLKFDWNQERNREALFRRCVTALSARGDRREFGSPERDRLLVWCVLEDLVYGTFPDAFHGPGNSYYGYEEHERMCDPPADLRQVLVNEARRVISQGSDRERGFAAAMVASTQMAAGLVHVEEYERLMLHEHESVWRWAAIAMIKSGHRDKLVTLDTARPKGNCMDIAWLLKRQMPDEPSELELKLWDRCAAQKASAFAYFLKSLPIKNDRNVLIRFREPILEFLRGEAAVSRVLMGGTNEEYQLLAALSILESYNQRDDNAVFLAYLTHPCSSIALQSTGGPSTKIRIFRVRQHASAILKRRDVSVLDKVVFEEKVDPSAEE